MIIADWLSSARREVANNSLYVSNIVQLLVDNFFVVVVVAVGGCSPKAKERSHHRSAPAASEWLPEPWTNAQATVPEAVLLEA